jgi:plasmid replication initiation protein
MIKNDDLIVKKNDLISSFISMTKTEYKFTLYLISQIRKEDKSFRIQQVHVKDFAETINFKGESIYSYLKKFEDILLTKRVDIEKSNGDRMKINWFSYVKYFNNEGIMEIAFNNDMVPYLLQVDTNYTKYYLKNVRELNSFNSIRIYEVLKQFQKVGTRYIDLEELKNMLGLTGQYDNYHSFKQRILIPAKKDINGNQNTDISFEFKEHKRGRKVVAIDFTITTKERLRSEKYEIKRMQIIGFCEAFNSKFGTELDHGKLMEFDFMKIMDIYGKFDSILEEERRKKKVKSIEALFVYCCREGYKPSTSMAKLPEKSDNMTNFDEREYKEEDLQEFYYDVEED